MQLRHLQRSGADRAEVRFCGHKGDQAQVGSVIVRTQSEVRGPCSELGEGGALMVALLSCFSALPEHAPLSSHCSGRQVRMWGYGQAF